MVTDRLVKDIHRLHRYIDSLSGGQASIDYMDGEDLHCIIIIITPDTGCFRGGKFDFQIKMSELYPNVPPEVTCLTPIFHPNISSCELIYGYSDDADVCVSLLDDWTSSNTLEDCVQALLFLIHNPNLDDPLNPLFSPGQYDEQQFYELAQKSLRGEKVDGCLYPWNYHLEEETSMKDERDRESSDSDRSLDAKEMDECLHPLNYERKEKISVVNKTDLEQTDYGNVDGYLYPWSCLPEYQIEIKNITCTETMDLGMSLDGNEAEGCMYPSNYLHNGDSTEHCQLITECKTENALHSLHGRLRFNPTNVEATEPHPTDKNEIFEPSLGYRVCRPDYMSEGLSNPDLMFWPEYRWLAKDNGQTLSFISGDNRHDREGEMVRVRNDDDVESDIDVCYNRKQPVQNGLSCIRPLHTLCSVLVVFIINHSCTFMKEMTEVKTSCQEHRYFELLLTDGLRWRGNTEYCIKPVTQIYSFGIVYIVNNISTFLFVLSQTILSIFDGSSNLWFPELRKRSYMNKKENKFRSLGHLNSSMVLSLTHLLAYKIVKTMCLLHASTAERETCKTHCISTEVGHLRNSQIFH